MVDYVHPTIQQLVEPPLAATTSAVFYMTLSKSPMDVKESLIFFCLRFHMKFFHLQKMLTKIKALWGPVKTICVPVLLCQL